MFKLRSQQTIYKLAYCQMLFCSSCRQNKAQDPAGSTTEKANINKKSKSAQKFLYWECSILKYLWN